MKPLIGMNPMMDNNPNAQMMNMGFCRIDPANDQQKMRF